jgi:DNA-binding IclR family transcriptional regulator
MPPLRLEILDDLKAHPSSILSEVRRRVDKPRSTVDRQLQSLHMLGLLTQVESVLPGTGWRYSLASDVNPVVLRP